MRFDHWGQSFATDGAGGEGINYVFPGVDDVHLRRSEAHLAGAQPGQPQALRAGNHQRPALSRRLARQPGHQRFSGAPGLPLRADRSRLGLLVAGTDRDHQVEARGVPPDRREDGPGRRAVHRRLVQPDHPARRSRLSRRAARSHARPHLARDVQRPPVGRASQAGRRAGGAVIGEVACAGGIHPVAREAATQGPRGGRSRAAIGRLGSGARRRGSAVRTPAAGSAVDVSIAAT